MSVHDAMQGKTIKKRNMTGQSFIEQAPHTHSKRQTGLVLPYESSFKYFSLKCFLLKSITNLFRKTQQNYKALGTKLEFDLTSKQA